MPLSIRGPVITAPAQYSPETAFARNPSPSASTVRTRTASASFDGLARRPSTLEGTASHRPDSTDIAHAAAKAIPYVRSLLPLKSDNKDYGEDDACIPPSKLARYHEDARDSRTILLNKIQCEIYALEATWRQSRQAPDFGALASIIASKGASAAGNCYEQAILAYDFLRTRLTDASLPIDIVSLEHPGNHNFVVIGQSTDGNGRYPKQFSDWHPDAFIVDPWTKIACRAADYPQKWSEKMEKWAARGLRVDDESPLVQSCLNLLRDNNKISRRQAFPSAQAAPV
ncbi:type III effector protein [Ralstonia solanacearum]|uniref:type III effector protein n=1 Tax=Ralstonia solanacearum TaxID=305 RepID=UPI0004ADFB19|nr:type III effector protein [Ralstonia solanacearum]MCL9845622.1 type III effector protein [Ralstonia solanacearum]MCL9848037.1 type III effector protein [Ralstonia solanacearum]MCL9854870.1 type III effector protein [Ralstonia solanacearum]MCL9860425.1 type III effector protein [Ralstonia solanacearum]MCL9864818.1 type III effector protein [Ralstonia solanacearum]